jgi:Flp pilus assembly protein TadD
MSLGLRPGDVATIVHFAERDARRGRLKEAIETLRVAAVLDPRELCVWDALALCFDKVGDASRAASAARVAAKIREIRGSEGLS